MNSLKAAVDLFLGHDLFDSINRCAVAFRCEPGALVAMDFFQLKVSIVQCVDEMRRRADKLKDRRARKAAKQPANGKAKAVAVGTDRDEDESAA